MPGICRPTARPSAATIAATIRDVQHVIADVPELVERRNLDLVLGDELGHALFVLDRGEPRLVVLPHGARLGVLRSAEDIVVVLPTLGDGRCVRRGVLLPLDIRLFGVDPPVWLRGDTPRFNRLLYGGYRDSAMARVGPQGSGSPRVRLAADC